MNSKTILIGLFVFLLLSSILIYQYRESNQIRVGDKVIKVVYSNKLESSENEVVFTFDGEAGDNIDLVVNKEE